MRKAIVFLSFFFIIFFEANAQLETNIWYFGANAGITFATNPPSALLNGALNTSEGCAVICNNTGSLLFYTDGVTVYNKNHLIMDNGTGLHGNTSSTQSAIIVPQPGSNTLYYIFTTDVQNLNNYGLQYAVVDMSMNGGLGKVISKNTLLIQPTSEKVTVVKHSNNSSYWLVTHGVFNNNFYSFLITSSGINTTPVVSSVGSYQNAGLKLIGYLKPSFNNNRLASVKNDGGEAELFDFDNSTGIVSNQVLIGNNEEFYGVEFSPDNSKLYITVVSPAIIYQFDLLASNIAASKNIVSYGQTGGGALQIGKNGKIYYIDWFNDSLGVINNPNNFNCNFIPNGIYLGGKNGRLGLPNFVPSLIISNCAPSASFVASDTLICKGNLINFTNTTLAPFTSQKWQINGQQFDTSYHANYIFTNTGVFSVSLIAFNGSCSDTAKINVKVNPVFDTTISPEICEGEMFQTGTHIYTISGTYIDTLLNYLGCDSVITTNLTVKPLPLINLGYDTTICQGSIFILNASFPNATYLWQDNSINQVFSVIQQGLYWVIATVDSCSSNDSINITFNDCEVILKLPNIITPNNDNSNDFFVPLQTKNISKMKTQIFNRWGNLVYETENIQIEWNGKHKANLVADGVYFWIINYTDTNGKEGIMKGSLTVLK